MDFVNKPTIETVKSLLSVKTSYQDHTQTYSSCIVETEAYLGSKGKVAHRFGGKQTPKVTSLYERGGTMYNHAMHTHLLINLVTREEGIPEGALICAVEPEDGIEGMKINRNKFGFELTNGPRKWTKAFSIPRAIDGPAISQCCLSIDVKNRKFPREIGESARIGIPNKGEQTEKHLKYAVKGNPYVSRMRKSDCLLPGETWKWHLIQ